MVKRLLAAICLSFGVSACALAGPSSPPAGKFILDVSTGVNIPTFKVASGTVTGPLYSNSVYVTGIANGSCLQSGPGGQVTAVGFSCSAGGGNANLASTQTWTGQNNWVTPAVSTFTYGVVMGSLTIQSQEILNPGAGIGYGVTAPNYNLDFECGAGDPAVYCTNISHTNAIALHVADTSNNPALSVANTFSGSPTSAGQWASAIYGTNSGQGSSGGVASYFQTAGSTATLVTATTGIGLLAKSTSGNAIQIDQGILQGKNFFFQGPTQSTMTYGLTVGSETVAGGGNGNIQLTISGSTYSVTSTSNTGSGNVTVGHLAVWSSTNATLTDGGAPSVGGGGGGVSVPSTFTWTKITESGVYYTTNTQTGTSYVITSTDTVIFAKGTLAAGANSNYTLPYSSNSYINNSGQDIAVIKVDATTGPVVLVTQGSDLIMGTTHQWILNAMGQKCNLIADGAGNWWPGPAGCQPNPGLITSMGSGEGTPYAISAGSTLTINCPVFLASPAAVTGFRYWNDGSAGGQVIFTIYDQFGNVIQSTGPVTPGTSAQTLTWPVLNLAPGYYGNSATWTASGLHLTGPDNAAGDGTVFCSQVSDAGMAAPNPYTGGASTTKPGVGSWILAGGRQGY